MNVHLMYYLAIQDMDMRLFQERDGFNSGSGGGRMVWKAKMTMRRILVGMVVGVISVRGGMALGQSGVVASEIPDRIENIEAIRDKYRTARDSYRDDRAKIMAEISKLRATSERLGREVQEMEVAVRSHHDDVVKYQASSGKMGKDISKICDAVIIDLSKTRENIQGGIPFDVAGRLENLSDAAAKIQSDDVDHQADGVKRYFSFHRQDFHLARSTEIVNDVVDISESRQLPGYVLRLGLVCQWFMTEDQSWIGRVKGGGQNGYERVDDVRESGRVLEAFSVMRRRRMPGLVVLVLPVNARADGK